MSFEPWSHHLKLWDHIPKLRDYPPKKLQLIKGNTKHIKLLQVVAKIFFFSIFTHKTLYLQSTGSHFAFASTNAPMSIPFPVNPD